MICVLYTGSRPPDRVVEGVALHHVPMLETVPLTIGEKAREALRSDHRRIAVFYSQNAVSHVLGEIGPELFSDCELWAVGERTAEQLEEHVGVRPQVPPTQTFEGLVELLRPEVTPQTLIISFELASSPRTLSGAGLDARVLSVPAYDTRAYNYDDLDALLRRLQPQWVVFASPRGHAAFRANLHHRTVGDNYRVAAIGTTTRDAILEAGDRVDHVASTPDLDVLLRELVPA